MKLRKFENEFLVYTQNHTKTDKFLYPKFPHRGRLVDGVYFHKKMDWAKRVGGVSVDFYWLPVKIDVGLSVQKFLKKWEISKLASKKCDIYGKNNFLDKIWFLCYNNI